tara:strand:- start:1981 stop:2127 length:147 start_codon:yes stop_codon:yes gene_type:complete
MAVKINEEEWDKISQRMARSLAGIDPDLTPNERAELLKKKSKWQNFNV